MKIAVYDQYWSTLGGGEQFAGGIAAALRDDHDVTLVGPDAIDTTRFAERLGIDLAGLPLQRIDQESDVSVLSADYDILVNCTYQSTAVNRAAHGIYVVHFPGEVAGARQRRKDEVRQAVGRRFPPTIVLRSGFYQPDRRGGVRRTDGASVVDVYAPRAHRSRSLWRPSTPRPSGCGIAVRCWRRPRSALVRRPTWRYAASGAWPQQVDPGERHLPARGSSRRDLALRRRPGCSDPRWSPPTRSARSSPHQAPAARPPRSSHDLRHHRLELRVHGAVGRAAVGPHSEVLYPPVRLRTTRSAKKEPLILNIGRSSTRPGPQQEAARAGAGVPPAPRVGRRRDGWWLHLVGGCSAEERDYAMAVKREALGLPGPRAPQRAGRRAERLLGPRRPVLARRRSRRGSADPPRPLRALRHQRGGGDVGGAVPVVFGAAGPAEVVRDGVDGVHSPRPRS